MSVFRKYRQVFPQNSVAKVHSSAQQALYRKTLLERMTEWDLIRGSKYSVLDFVFPTLAYINATSVLIVPWGMLGASKL